MSLPNPSNVSFEFLELLAAAHAPPGGAAIWAAGKDFRLVRHKGEPLTVSFCSALVTDTPKAEVSKEKFPASIVATYHEGVLRHPPKRDRVWCNKVVMSALYSDCVDSDKVERAKRGVP